MTTALPSVATILVSIVNSPFIMIPGMIFHIFLQVSCVGLRLHVEGQLSLTNALTTKIMGRNGVLQKLQKGTDTYPDRGENVRIR